MDNDILMFIMLISVQLVVLSIALAIFSSLFMKSRKKGLIFLIIYILISIYNLFNAYAYSSIMGNSILIIYISSGIGTYFVLKKRISKVNEV